MIEGVQDRFGTRREVFSDGENLDWGPWIRVSGIACFILLRWVAATGCVTCSIAVCGRGIGDFCGSRAPSRPSSASPVSQTRKNLQQYSGEQIQSSREISRDDGNIFRPL